ncbi:EamA family transporter RarD [Opitutus terrae]|uniref:RarD protein, DMT superfamily transporter n=1 Tax=Opitutus terrae (strain DSM 11246 / JCM 15787 / PB90-1) TaxID=452637 RepID=B1ZWV4_OPITP|nr:EamA family transporter RarD [Opitutus terrae]ACB74228.1 RarD protein, DMT superfamily transporter [Opitutus terrae PB90-1]
MPTPDDLSAPARGALAAALAYLAWGLFPLYWTQLGAINALELIAHRHLSSLVFVLAIMAVGPGWSEFLAALRSGTALRWHLASGLLLTANWLVFVWGVNHGYVLESSLGYFLVPLVNVAFGRFLLHEHLRRLQWLAIACASLGVLLLLLRAGRLPWIALALAATFGFYGLLRKRSPLGPLVGLGVETLLLAPLALAFVVWQQHSGAGALGRVSVGTHVLLLSAGVVTAVPLLLFAYGARRIRFSTLGLLQYIGPTVQFALGAWFYREPFSPERAAAFGFIWAGLALYTVDNLWNQPRLTAA